jgi:hypothetical protein
MRDLLDDLSRQGWRIEHRQSAVLAYAPTGEGLVTMHRTESDPRAAKNTLARLRRLGFEG